MTSYKAIRAVADAVGKRLDVSSPDALCIQSSVSAQPPRIDVRKLRSPQSGALLAKKLKSTRNRCTVGTSKTEIFC